MQGDQRGGKYLQRRDVLLRVSEPDCREEGIHIEGQSGIRYLRLSGLRRVSRWVNGLMWGVKAIEEW